MGTGPLLSSTLRVLLATSSSRRELVPGVGNDPTSYGLQPYANPFQLSWLMAVPKGIEPSPSDRQSGVLPLYYGTIGGALPSTGLFTVHQRN